MIMDENDTILGLIEARWALDASKIRLEATMWEKTDGTRCLTVNINDNSHLWHRAAGMTKAELNVLFKLMAKVATAYGFDVEGPVTDPHFVGIIPETVYSLVDEWPQFWTAAVATLGVVELMTGKDKEKE